MSWFQRFRVAAAVGATVLLSAALLAGCGSSDEYDSQQLTLLGSVSGVEYVDANEKGSSRGDTRAFTNELFEEGGNEPVGRLDGSVVITDLGKLDGTDVEYRNGEIQFTLEDGNIVAAGNYVAETNAAVPAEGGIVRAIVGGTGAYYGARGEVTQTAESDEQLRYELDFETPSE